MAPLVFWSPSDLAYLNGTPVGVQVMPIGLVHTFLVISHPLVGE